MTPKIAIVGSCVTRDVFAFHPASPFEVTHYVARTSFISMMAPPVPLDAGKLSVTSGFELRCIKDDFSKETRNIFESDFDYIIFDFIDERFDIIQIANSYVLGTITMQESGALEQHPDHRRLPRLDEEVQALWNDACKRVCAEIRQKIPPHKIILHKAWHASHYLEHGSQHSFGGFHERFARLHNPVLQAQYALFEAELGGIRTVEARPEHILADGEHRWGRQPFHFVSGYYQDLLEALLRLTAPAS